MSSIGISTGAQNDETIIAVNWFDHNNIRRKTEVTLKILPQDKPRTLAIIVNGVTVVTLDSNSQEEYYGP